MSKAKKIKNYCSNCQKETNHTILHLETEHGELYGGELQYEVEYAIIRCDGCNHISFRKESSDSENHNPEDPEGSVSVELFPVPFKGYGDIDKNQLPVVIRQIYEETCNSIANGNLILAGIGLRSIIEAISKVENITGKLNKQINSLATKGIISKNDARCLHAIRFLGNDAVHDIHKPTYEQVQIALNIIETLITSRYILINDANEYLDLPIEDYQTFKSLIITLSKKTSRATFSCEELLDDSKKKRLIVDDADLKEYIKKFDADVVSGVITSIIKDSKSSKYSRKYVNQSVIGIPGYNKELLETLVKFQKDIESIPGYSEMIKTQQKMREEFAPYIKAIQPVLDAIKKVK